MKKYDILSKSFSGYYETEIMAIMKKLSDKDPEQLKYLKWQLNQCKKVEMIPLIDAIPIELFNCIRRDKIHKKGCYKAAYSIVDSCYDRDLKYVEGFGCLHGVNIQHAWVKYKDKYFDPIAWFVFNERTNILEEYNAIIELDKFELYKLVAKTNVYGPNIEPYYKMFVHK